MGCTFGKFSKTKKFKLHVTCLDYVAQHAQYKAKTKAHERMRQSATHSADADAAADV